MNSETKNHEEFGKELSVLVGNMQYHYENESVFVMLTEKIRQTMHYTLPLLCNIRAMRAGF